MIFLLISLFAAISPKSLDPSSCSQQFLFSTISENPTEIQQVKETGWKVISDKPLDDPKLLDDLSFLQLIDTMHRPFAVTDPITPLSLETLSSFEKALKPLPHKNLKGHTATTEEEVIALQDEEIDVAHALLLALKLDETRRRSYELMLDMMALEIQAKLPADASINQKVHTINHYLFFDIGFRFPPLTHHEKNSDLYTNIPNVLESKRGVCLGVSLIYYSLAQRVNLPLSIYTPPGHIFLATDSRTIEPTARGVNIPMSEYLSVETKSVRKRTPKELIGLMLMNGAATHLEKSHWKEARDLYFQAISYLPEDAHVHTLLGATLYVLKDARAKKYLSFALEHPQQELLVPNVLAEDLLHDRIDAQSLTHFFTGYEKTKNGREEKCAQLLSVIKKNPKFRGAYTYVAGLEMESLQPDMALFHLEELSKIDPNNLESEYMLAALWHERFDEVKAIEHLNNCKRILETLKETSPFIKDLDIELAAWK